MGPPEQPDSLALQVAGGDDTTVDKIRDILFGKQMRDYEQRFSRIEEQLIKTTADIRESNRRRFEQLENHIHQEFAAVREQMQADAPGYSAAASSDGGRGDEGIRARSEELVSIIESRVRDLRSGRIDRAELASLFTEVALRLSDEFRAPRSET